MRDFINLLIILLLVLSTPIQSVAGEEPQLDTKAMTILAEAIALLESVDLFEIQATAVFDVVQEDGQRLQFEKKSRLVQQRPNKLYVEQLRDDGNMSHLWYDGSQVSILNVGDNAYTQFRAPETVDGMLDMLERLLKDPHPLADLLYSDLGFLLTEPDEAIYVGPSAAAGFPCSHLAFRNANLDWQLWVENGDTPFIRKVVVTYRNKPGVPQFVSYMHEWKVLPAVDEDVFLFSRPENAEKLSILIPPATRAEEGGQL